MRILLILTIAFVSCSPEASGPELPPLPCPPESAPCDCDGLAEASHPSRCYRGEPNCRWRMGYAPLPGTIYRGYCTSDGRCACGLTCVAGECQIESETLAVNEAPACGGGGE